MTNATTLLGALAVLCGCDNQQSAAAVAKPGFGDCDNDAKNGAETDLSSTVQHCGACGQACKDVFPPAGHGEFSCVDSRCSLRCDDGWEACEGVTAGCNTDLSRDHEHCGKCGTACMLSYCQGGTCVEPKTVVREIEAWKLVASTREGAYILDDAFPLPVRTMVVFVVPFDGGEPRKVTFGDLVPMASDGEHLYGCRTPVGPRGSDCRLARKPVAGGAVQSLAVVKKAHPWTCLAADEGHVYLYVETGEEQGSIVAVPVAGGEVKKLLDTPEVASLTADEGTVFYGTNFTKNGETAVYALPKGATKPILLTRAWPTTSPSTTATSTRPLTAS